MSALHVGLFTECYRPIQNGVVASLDALADALRARGHEVTFVTPAMPGVRETRSDVVRIPSLPLPTRTAYRLTIPLLTSQAESRLAQLSIVHTHSPFVTGWMGARIARRLHVPLVFTYHTQLEEYAHYVPFDVRTTRSAVSHLTRAHANAADAVIVPTDAMKARLRDLGVRVRIAVAPSGIDVAQFAGGTRREDMRRRLGAGAAKIVLFVGRLAREKNVELALEAGAALGDPGIAFAVVGEGPHREALERAAARLGLADRVRFTGEMPRAELPDVYASADAFVFTSRSDTQGLVLAEALAAGLPIVAVDAPQTREVLGGAGSVVPAEARALAAALRTALAAERRVSADAAGARRFDAAAAGERILGLYRDLLSASPVPAAV